MAGVTSSPGRASARSRLLFGLLAACGVVITVMLGNWQTGRASQKSALQARLEVARAQPPVHLDTSVVESSWLEYKRVEVRGQFLSQHSILLDNRLRNGAAGYEVLTPLKLSGGRVVVVNRGWVRASPDRSALPEIDTPAGMVTVSGIALPVSDRFVELSGQTISGRVWQNLDFDRYRQHTGLDLLPLVLQQHDAIGDGLDRNWPRPDLRIDTNRAYALQWYTMAVAIAIIYLIYHVRSTRNRS